MKKCKHVTVVHEWRTDENGDEHVIRKRCSPTAGCGALLPFREPANDAPPEVLIEIRAAELVQPDGKINGRALTKAEATALAACAIWCDMRPKSSHALAAGMPRGDAGWLAYEIVTHDDQRAAESATDIPNLPAYLDRLAGEP